MLVVVCYDVATGSAGGERRLRHLAKLCQDYGQRVQKSVFECLVDPAQWEYFKADLLGIVREDKDSLRFYFLGKNWKNRVEHYGAKEPWDPQGTLLL